VEENHQKLGIIVESGIRRVDPELHLLIKEKNKLEAHFKSNRTSTVTLSGFCQDSGNCSDDLRNVNGIWLCEGCENWNDN